MKEHCGKNRQGMGLVGAGAIVFLVGLTIALFKEFNLPRYWIPAVIGVMLMVAGAIVYGIKRTGDHQESSK